MVAVWASVEVVGLCSAVSALLCSAVFSTLLSALLSATQSLIVIAAFSALPPPTHSAAVHKKSTEVDTCLLQNYPIVANIDKNSH